MLQLTHSNQSIVPPSNYHCIESSPMQGGLQHFLAFVVTVSFPDHYQFRFESGNETITCYQYSSVYFCVRYFGALQLE